MLLRMSLKVVPAPFGKHGVGGNAKATVLPPLPRRRVVQAPLGGGNYKEPVCLTTR